MEDLLAAVSKPNSTTQELLEYSFYRIFRDLLLVFFLRIYYLLVFVKADYLIFISF